MIKQILISMRPNQWVKNLLLFAGVIFSQNLLNSFMLIKTFYAFFLFCLLCSSVYIINDVIDLRYDRAHPLKSRRPIASGKLKIFSALLFSGALALLSFLFSYYLSGNFFLVCLIYFALNIVYSKYLKHIVILDVMCISAGFVLRAVAGAVVIDVIISPWLVVCTTLLALFLGFGKRRYELILLEDKANTHRKILTEYSPYFLDQLISVVTASTVVAYAFYTLSPEVKEKLNVEHLELTIPFVLYGIFRYLYLIHQKEKGGSPSKLLLTDFPILIDIFLWLICVLIIVYI